MELLYNFYPFVNKKDITRTRLLIFGRNRNLRLPCIDFFLAIFVQISSDRYQHYPCTAKIVDIFTPPLSKALQNFNISYNKSGDSIAALSDHPFPSSSVAVVDRASWPGRISDKDYELTISLSDRYKKYLGISIRTASFTLSNTSSQLVKASLELKTALSIFGGDSPSVVDFGSKFGNKMHTIHCLEEHWPSLSSLHSWIFTALHGSYCSLSFLFLLRPLKLLLLYLFV